MKVGVLSKLNTILILIITHLKHRQCERRVIAGKRVTDPKHYMVYILWQVKVPSSSFYSNRDKDTLCGGVIINPWFILSSAACLKMKVYQYVVAGYMKYIPIGDISTDECYKITGRILKKKCYLSYKRKSESDPTFYSNTTEWTYKDIGVGMVDKPYSFVDKSFLKHCPYMPNPAKLSFEKVKIGTEVTLLGWGAMKYHRPGNYAFNVNEEYLMSTSTIVIENTGICKDAYSKVNVSVETKLCTDGDGHLDPNGKYSREIRRDNSNYSSEDVPSYVYDINNVPNNYTIVLFNVSYNGTRRNGPCENDHGGPLVSWIEGVEHVVGIVVGYLVDKNWRCVGPFIYEPVANYKHFIECSTTVLKNKTTRRHCEGSLAAIKQSIQEENINWAQITSADSYVE